MTATPQTFSCANHLPLPVVNKAGVSYCYNCVIESLQSPAYNLARRLLGDWSLAEDAVQESFVSGYRAFAQFRGDNLKAWVMRIVANACRDMLRSRRSRRSCQCRPHRPSLPTPPRSLRRGSPPSCPETPD